jgi:hypothetical protein
MLIDERREQVKRLLQEIKGLSADERQRVVALELPIFESLVMAEMCRAHSLLARDHAFDWKQREQEWHAWRDHMLRAVEASLRYHTNDAMIIAMGVCAALFPLVHRGAGLMGYKTLDDIIMTSQRTGNANKKERAELRLRVKDLVARVSVWECPPDQLLLHHEAVSNGEATESAGIALEYSDPKNVIRLVECVMPIRWQVRPDKTLIVPVLPSPEKT